MRALLVLPLCALCVAIVAHPYPYRHSAPARHSITFPRVMRYFTQTQPHHSRTNQSEAPNRSHLRVPDSPLPATIGGGRTLPSSAFYALKFTIPTNSSSRNATRANSTRLQHASRTNRSDELSTPSVNNTSQSRRNATRAPQPQHTSLSALGLHALHQLMSSFTSPHPSHPNSSHSIATAAVERSEHINASVKLAQNLSLSDILRVIMSAAQNDTQLLSAASASPQQRTNASSAQNRSEPLAIVKPSNQSSTHTNMSKHIATNSTPHRSNSLSDASDTLPQEAYEIIHKLHALVHVSNHTHMSQHVQTTIARAKHRDELLQLTKRYVRNLYRTLFPSQSRQPQPQPQPQQAATRNASMVWPPKTASRTLSEDADTLEADDDTEASESEWSHKWHGGDSDSTPTASAQASAEQTNEWRDKADTQSERSAWASASMQPSSSSSAFVSDNEWRDTHEWTGAATPSASATATPTWATPRASDAEGDGTTGSALATSSASASASEQAAVSVPPMAVPMRLENEYGVRDGENVTQLADMVYKLVREEGVFSMAVAPCDEVTDWMPDVVARLRHELVELQFYCVDTRVPRRELHELKRVFGEVATGFIQTDARSVREAMPAELDLVVSWKGLQRWGMETGWQFLRGLRDRGTKLLLVSNNAGVVNMEGGDSGVNVRGAPLLFGEPRRVIGDVTHDNSLQLLLYEMDDVREGF
eukprot:TRINITY_DN168_c1_g1_i4.p1 TRINITY_DN168_c1_g1~~TRINITY_DN168_c1_g1_i4.p1  ORF type:complete len:705 (-),score=157.70 TRINITY_DN168_c1_g1_i4:7552-9666(-)